MSEKEYEIAYKVLMWKLTLTLERSLLDKPITYEEFRHGVAEAIAAGSRELA